jgi:Flp pilus assembly protein TadB
MIALLLARWRFYGAVAVSILAALAIAYFLALRADLARTKAANVRLKSELVTAQTQAKVETEASQIADTAQTRALNITVKAGESVHEIQSAPGASDPVPPAVAAAWAAGIDGVRSNACASPDATDPAEPSGAVPSPC